jgi:hypothetical protein
MTIPTIKIEGLDEALKRLNSSLYAEPLRRFWQRVGILVINQAHLNAPVDTGRLRSSLAQGAPNSISEIDSANPPLWAKVGTNVNREGFFYPRALEESDRYHHRGGGAGGAGNLKAKAQSKFGGQPTKGWFSGSIREAVDQLDQWLDKLKEEIAARWRQ